MNKVSVLLTAAILGSTSITYAQEVPDIIKKLGWEKFYEDGGPPPETGEGDLPLGPPPDWTIPAQIEWNNDDPVYNLRLCNAGPVMDDTEMDPNRHMGDFNVTACGTGIPGGCETVLFTYPGMNGPYPHGGGDAIGTSWKLVQWGRQTWDLPWTIELDSGVILDSIEIDLLSKKGRIKAGFDILLRPNDEHPLSDVTDSSTGVVYSDHPHPSPGSGAGWPVDEQPPFAVEVNVINYKATFYNPIVLLTGLPLQNPHDLYGKVVIEFPGGLTRKGTGAIPDLGMEFWQDTDCLPVYSFEIVETDKVNGMATFTATGIGMRLYVLKVSETGTVEEVLNDGLPFEVSLEEGETTITRTVRGLQEGTLYQVVDVADDGSENVVYGPERF